MDVSEQATQYYLDGLRLYGEQKHEEALEAYDKALLEAPDWTEALHGKAMAKMYLEQYDEAIEIGKKFSTANSGGFVNGILDRIRIDLNQNKATPKAAKTQEQSAAEGGPKHAEGDAAAADS